MSVYAKVHMDKTDGDSITPEVVYIVVSCRALQNSKALARLKVSDGKSTVITTNGVKQVCYLYATKKL